MLRFMVAPDSFKESLSATDFCTHARAAILAVVPHADVTLCPMADGGEGTAAAIVHAWRGTTRTYAVTGPLGSRVRGAVGFAPDGRAAVIDMASASGLALVAPGQRNPLQATSYGTGELLAHALDSGVQEIILGLGGSAVNDGGAGLLQALGYRLLTADGKDIAHSAAGLAALRRVDASRRHPRLPDVRLRVACDVVNPLLGPTGASAVFGPQKGADAAMVAELDRLLSHYADVVEAHTGTVYRAHQGAGACGGSGFALLSLLGAQFHHGFELIADIVGLTRQLHAARFAWILSGEGRVDAQTRQGKLLSRLGRLAQEVQTPVLAFTGQIVGDERELGLTGISAIIPIVRGPCTLEAALENAAANLRAAIERTLRLVLLRVP